MQLFPNKSIWSNVVFFFFFHFLWAFSITSCHKSCLRFFIYSLALHSRAEKYNEFILDIYYAKKQTKSVRPEIPHDMQIWSFMDTKWKIFPRSSCRIMKNMTNWSGKVELSNFKNTAARINPTVQSHRIFSSSAICLCCAALLALLCFDVSAVSVISPSLPLSHASWFPLGKSTASGQ